MSPWDHWQRDKLAARSRAGLLRKLKPLEPGAHPLTARRPRGPALTLFSTNDYLGLSHHPQVLEAARAARSMGPRGSALVCGYTQEHARLEAAIASLKGTQTALLFPTGYAANLATLAALGSPEVTFFSDELNHASIVDGLSLAKRRGARVVVYPHADLPALKALTFREPVGRRLAIVTDTVFSMDGDLAPLKGLAALCQDLGALFIVDEAHATLVWGPQGGGACQAAGVRPHLSVGTLSKAAGALGGFVAASAPWRAFLLNFARTQIYSTALPLPLVAAARAALELDTSAARARLWAYVEHVHQVTGHGGQGPIVPVVLGPEDRALQAAETLEHRHQIHCVAIRPPTVPPGTSRLRVTLSAAHTEADIARLCDALLAL